MFRDFVQVKFPKWYYHPCFSVYVCVRAVSYKEQENIMSKPKDRTVSKQPDGRWENKRNDTSRASSLHDTQKAAQDAARELLKKQGGGELTTKGVDGKIRDKDPVAPGNDPRRVKG